MMNILNECMCAVCQAKRQLKELLKQLERDNA